MDKETIDFEGTGFQGGNSQSDNNSSANGSSTTTQTDVTNLNGDDKDDVTGKDGSSSNQTQTNNNDDSVDNSSTGELVAGDTIEVDGTSYVIAENGDIVDEKGNIFKEAKDVAEWLKSVEVEEDNDSDGITLASIQDALGVTVTDEEGNPIEFTEDANGIKAYVDSVIAIRSNELQEAAINRLYQDNPLLKQFQDYVQLTGTPRGFGEIPDRSDIQLDKNNEAQLVAVIKMAAQEFGNKSLTDSYIQYLKDSGALYDEAKTQLSALVDKDEAYRKELEDRARAKKEEEAKSVQEYWGRVSALVNSRKIGNYMIPESFVKEVNGQKVTITPRDFYNYVSSPVENEDGVVATAYQHDLAKLTDEEYLNREMLDAWLMLTGGTYKDLIDMAFKEEQVRKMRVKSKNRSSSKTVKVIRNNAGKASIDDIIL